MRENFFVCDKLGYWKLKERNLEKVLIKYNFLSEWGLSKKKHRKPFREAFKCLSRLNDLGAPYELHSATIKDTEDLYKLLGRRNSLWKMQIQIPERSNLRYFLISGSFVPTSVLQLPFVTNFLSGDSPDILMIFVQTIEEGSQIFFDLYEFSLQHSLLDFPSRKTHSEKKFAFLHSNLTDETKQKILSDAINLKIRILIATSSAGAGVNLPISTFLGWGLDREPSGIVQASGRTARGRGEGNVVWVHNTSHHGRRVPMKSLSRDLLKGGCLRSCQNAWFSHGTSSMPDHKPEPHDCCSVCMENCLSSNPCDPCSTFLKQFKVTLGGFVKCTPAVKVLTEFLESLNIVEKSPPGCPKFEESSLAKNIIDHLADSPEESDTQSFLDIFSLGDELNQEISSFIRSDLSSLISKSPPKTEMSKTPDLCADSSEQSSSNSETDSRSEYFDESE